MLAALIEVSIFQDIGKHSEEILNYLRIIITAEPVYCLRNVQQVVFFLFPLIEYWFQNSFFFLNLSVT